MTKLEAWKVWCDKTGTADLATEFTLEKSSHGKAFSYAWDAAVEECAKVVEGSSLPDAYSEPTLLLIAEEIRSRK